MLHVAKVTQADPLEVQFFGDEDSGRLEVGLDSYTPAADDIVLIVEFADGQPIVLGKVVDR